jgi:hypothetical protein
VCSFISIVSESGTGDVRPARERGDGKEDGVPVGLRQRRRRLIRSWPRERLMNSSSSVG